jgi:hypothetical protein
MPLVPMVQVEIRPKGPLVLLRLDIGGTHAKLGPKMAVTIVVELVVVPVAHFDSTSTVTKIK